MSRKSPTMIIGGLAGFILISLLVYGGLVNRIAGPLFVLGIRHGIEDRQSGITYSTDAPIWRMSRPGPSFKSSDWTLLQKMVADGANVSFDSSLFMAGYRLGYNALLLGIGLMIVIAGTVGITLRQKRHTKNIAIAQNQGEFSQ